MTWHENTHNVILTLQIQERVDPAYSNKDKLLRAVDSLPPGVQWNLENIKLTGDMVDEEGNTMTEELELWYRDPVECIRELVGNPMFQDAMKYAPEKLFEDKEGNDEVVNEMWTGEWWWKLQVSPTQLQWGGSLLRSQFMAVY